MKPPYKKYICKKHYPVEMEKLEQRATRVKQGFENIRVFKRWERDRSAVFGKRLRGAFF